MSTQTPTGQESAGTTDRIDGPIPETNHRGALTGYTYYECTHCGREAMREQDLENCCRGGL